VSGEFGVKERIAPKVEKKDKKAKKSSTATKQSKVYVNKPKILSYRTRLSLTLTSVDNRKLRIGPLMRQDEMR
jgi:hypothetical protein